MPARDVLKQYAENSYYHIYNRGVNKRVIFHNEQDFRTFLSYLKIYLEPKNESSLRSILGEQNKPWAEKEKAYKLLSLNNFYNEILLLCFSLIPNHFHLLVRQKSAKGIESFMRSLGTKYVRYFNKKYKRVGPLFQDTYKAVLVKTDAQLLHLTCYIHTQVIKHSLYPKSSSRSILKEYPYSSYGDYLGLRKTKWLHPEEILSFFKTAQRTSLQDILSYQSFVENHNIKEAPGILGNFTLE